MNTRPLTKGFGRLAWLALGYNVLVILWGALVRATGSGNGCGANWPSCQGEVIPLGSALATWIEFAHRASSGIALLWVVGLVVWAFRRFAQGHRVRKAAAWSLVFILIEALVGAGLVLFELVADNSSNVRALVIALHLANTFLLLGALTLTAWWGSGRAPIAFKHPDRRGGWLVLAAGCVMGVGMLGAVTALGDTLFPMAEMQSLGQDLKGHFLVQLRSWHPVLAVLLGAVTAGVVYAFGRTNATLQRWGLGVIALYAAQLGLGVLNIALSAPLWLQLVHLGMADLIWIVFVIYAAVALRPS